jgi:hypothetical protein
MAGTLKILFLAMALFAGMTGCAVMAPALTLKDTVITDRTIWTGEVVIDGIVTVKKEGELVILPGTRVKFVPHDRDGDGIGDAELLVEGRLLAQGTADAPIVFTSAAKEPKPADWKYVYLDFAAPSTIDYIVSEYAYSGLQVHFSRATVTNSIFRFNVDGLRFSTVNLVAAGNSMLHNRHGLRYEERDSKAHIHHNDIRFNGIGVFVVTRSDDQSVIEKNNIFENQDYNVKLGLQQLGDVTFPHNWWGTTNPASIEAGFFDHRVDSALGRVFAPSPRQKPIEPSDWQRPLKE